MNTAAQQLEVPDEALTRYRYWIVAELRRLADIAPAGPARTILLNEADELEAGQ